MVNYMQYVDKASAKPPKYDAQEEEEDQMRFRDVWPMNPEFRDINRKSQAVKVGSLIGIFGIMIAHLLLLSFPMLTIVELFIFSLMLFILTFKDRTFYFQRMFSFKQFDPFDKLVFWQTKEDPNSVFFTHQADLMTIGVRIFRVEVIPENVSASIKHFVRSAATNFHPINYQVVHQPLGKSSVPQGSFGNHESQRTYIYFTVTKKITGSVTVSKVQKMMRSLQEQSSTLSSRFIADFHHYKIILLSREEASMALRTIFLRLPEPSEKEHEAHEIKGISPTQAFTKGAITLLFSIFNGWLATMVWNNSGLSIGISFITALFLIGTWWKELRFHVSSRRVFTSDEVVILDPFEDLSFFRFKSAPETIFFHSAQEIVGGIHAFNVRHVPQPLYFSENKLYHPLIGKGISFSTVFSAVPISFHSFLKCGYKKLNYHTRNHLCYNVQSEEERRVWMVQRAGMWKTEMILSTQAYRKGKEASIESFREIEMELQENSKELLSLFSMQYSGCELETLTKNRLSSAVLMTALKTRYTRLGGSHLIYSLIQGLDFFPFLTIDNAFKKGIETKIAAEFNTPLHLDNEVSLGHTINTEFLEQEVTAGFSLEQARQLLIMNGTTTSREEVSLLLARNLIIQGKHVIYFDFTGSGSKLIGLLKKDSLSDTVLHYRLGKTLTIDPIHSEIPHDPQNVQFLNLMLDAYALCFKKDDHTVAMFKNSLSQLSTSDNESLVGFRTISLAIDSQQDWKKSPAVSSIISTLDDFTEQDSAYLFSHDKSLQVKSTVLEFLKSDKSVIIDVSTVNDLEKQCFFTWLIMAKYLHYHSQSADYFLKYFFIPNIDMVFDQYFLEKRMKYGKIMKFIQPLFQAGHGFICTASQAHYLHSSLYSTFQNYITFQANDKRDISVLKNVLNLEELHGQGYYSKSRNEAYQVRYLMTMRPHEALMKRDDIYQSFPVEFDLGIVQSTPPLSWTELISHMKDQGYDIEDAERKIFRSAQKTVLEKDFGSYTFLIPEIINLLEGLQTVHQVGNLYRSKIAEELKHSIYPKLSKISKDKRQLKRMREEVLTILFSRGYLIESHPRQASGGQSIRTSYQVSPKFRTVLDDYYQAKRGISANVQLEVVAEETESIPDFTFSTNSTPNKQPLPSRQILPILKRIAIDILQWNLFQMHQSKVKQDYERCLKIGIDLPDMFLSNLQAEIERLPEIDRNALRSDFIPVLCSIEDFPMTKAEVERWKNSPQAVVSADPITRENIQATCQKLYEVHSQFAHQLEPIISGDEM